jgi:hypothetical protein
MTATRQPRNPLTRWAIRTLRCLNDELLAAGEAMARSARVPQPRPQADPEQITSGHPASVGEVLTGV